MKILWGICKTLKGVKVSCYCNDSSCQDDNWISRSAVFFKCYKKSVGSLMPNGNAYHSDCLAHERLAIRKADCYWRRPGFSPDLPVSISICWWGFWGFVKSQSTFFYFLVVSLTYWVSVPYKKSQDGDYGDLSNPIWHFLRFSFLLVGKSYILVISCL